jgi:hypothetical protein
MMNLTHEAQLRATAISWEDLTITAEEHCNVAYKQGHTNSHFEMVHDAIPVEDGGIRKGAKFCWDDIRYCFDLQSFTAGTVLYDNTRMKHFEVVYPFPKRLQGNNLVVDVDKLIEMYEEKL